jgi:hypothetical protein
MISDARFSSIASCFCFCTVIGSFLDGFLLLCSLATVGKFACSRTQCLSYLIRKGVSYEPFHHDPFG